MWIITRIGSDIAMIRCFTIVAVFFVSSPAGAERLNIAPFGAGDVSAFEEKVFSGKTVYNAARIDGEGGIRAVSEKSASGLFRKIEIDLEKTPWLNWYWRVENTLPGLDERTKEGDDYPARIYVVFSGGLIFWKTRALNYVWSGSQPAGAVWPNAFTSNAYMTAVESGNAKTGKWIREKRNVREDFKRIFGKDVKKADAVAVMTDTDNGGGKAVAYYGDIWFSSE